MFQVLGFPSVADELVRIELIENILTKQFEIDGRIESQTT